MVVAEVTENILRLFPVSFVYMGEDRIFTHNIGEMKMSSCGCNEIPVKDTQQSTNTRPKNRIVNIDFLFLDLSVCTRCQGTEGSIEDSLKDTSEFLKGIGYEVKVNRIHVETEEQAIEHRFVSSPTIRINGRDIQIQVKESHCSSCSSLTDGASVDCRLWLFNGEEFSVPPKEMIIDAVMHTIYNPEGVSVVSNEDKSFVLPDNLREYFAKKDKLCANVDKLAVESNCGCESSSC